MLRVVQKIGELFTLFCLALFVLLMATGNSAYAEEIETSVNIAPKLTLTVPSSPARVTLNPRTGPDYQNTTLYVYVSTNNYTGYYMTMSADTTRLINTQNASNYIETISSPTSGTYYMGSNTWGYRINSSGNYLPFVPGAQIISTDKPANNVSVGVDIGSRVDASLAPGVYEIELDFVAVANDPMTIYIQDLKQSYCLDTPTLVVDARDNREYTIQKLADGNCWMLDNLSLDPTEVPLAVLQGNTNAPDEALAYFKNGGGSSPYATNGVVSGTGMPESRTTGYVNSEYRDIEVANFVGSHSSKVGVYYNYCAASAGTVCAQSNSNNAEYDICPKGWRLPASSANDEINNGGNEFQNLYLAYNSNIDNLNRAFKTFATGAFWVSNPNSPLVYSDGYFWSSTIETANSMHYAGIGRDNISSTAGTDRNHAFPIRCIRDRGKLPTVRYLQDLTADMIASIPEEVSFTLIDKRDNEVYEVAKLADGNVWMLENLRLDPAAVSLETLKGNTNATNETLTYLKNGGGSGRYPAYGVSNSFANDATRPYVASNNKNTLVSMSYDGSVKGKAGVHYNYCAASAGYFCASSSTGNSDQDICPAGWRMPTGGASGEYLMLNAAYSNNATATNTALKTTLAGYTYSDNSPSSMGSSVYLWTSTAASSSSVYTTTPSFGNGTDSRYYGQTVRCIFNKE